MFARKVSMHLKVDGAAEFKKKMESEVIPFCASRRGSSTKSPSYTQRKRSSCLQSVGERAARETYNRGTFPEVTKILTSVIEGTARVRRTRSSIQRSKGPSPPLRLEPVLRHDGKRVIAEWGKGEYMHLLLWIFVGYVVGWLSGMSPERKRHGPSMGGTMR